MAGPNVDLQRPAGGERNGGDEVLVGVDDPLAGEVVGDETTAEAVAVVAAVAGVGRQFGGDDRW